MDTHEQQPRTQPQTDRDDGIDTGWVARTNNHGSKTHIHRLHPSTDSDNVENGDAVGIACQCPSDPDREYRAKPTSAIPDGYYQPCSHSACFGTE